MLEGIAGDWPNGLHDAFLRTLTIDCAARRATLALNVWVGDLDAESEAEREAYRPLTLTISGLRWCIIESPESGDDATDKGLWIDAGPLSDLQDKPTVPSVPADAVAWWIFVREWNAFIYLAGQAVSEES
jgi:hypothetical protein